MCAESRIRIRWIIAFVLILRLLAVPVTAEETAHRIYLRSNMGGTVSVSADSAAEGELITVECVPESGWFVDGINIYYDSEERYDLDITFLSDEARSFRMPPCEIWIEVSFLCEGPAFDDVPRDSYFYESVFWAVNSGITHGTGHRTFSPDSPCTRAQVVTFLWRAMGCPEAVSRSHPFTDVDETAYYYEAMLWALENGITKGTDDTHFSPNTVCSRGMTVTLLHRFCGDRDPFITEHGFTDLDESQYYYRSVLWAVQCEVTTGVTATTFAPEADCTRAQALTFLFRYTMYMH